MRAKNTLQLREAPRCRNCANSARPKATLCVDCLESQKDRYWSRVQQGLCIGCGRAVLAERRRCTDCAQRHVAMVAKLRATRKQHHVCIQCGKHPAFLDHVVCPVCYQKQKRAQARSKRRKQRRAQSQAAP